MDEQAIASKLTSIPEWTREGGSIRRQYIFDGFPSAVAFVVRIGFDAEAADHHPDILISGYRRVSLTFTTHDAPGLSEKDFDGALKADRVFGQQQRG